MIFTFDKALLLPLQSAMEAAGKTLLSNVKLELTGNDIAISCTDTKMFYNTIAIVEGKEDGTCLIPIGKLCEVIGSLKADSIEFKLDENKAIIKQGKSRLTIRTMDITNFPESPTDTPVSMFDIHANVIREIVQKVAYAVSSDETRYFMNGVFCEIKGNVLKAVATDGRRLAMCEYPVTTPDVNGIIVPPRLLAMIAKRARNNVKMAFDGKFIAAEFDNTVITGVCIDGKFPNYSKVIPESQKYKFVANRKEVLDGLNRVGLFTDSKSRRMFIELTKTMLTLTTDESDLGSAKEEIEVDHNGDAIKIALNSSFLVDCLKASDAEKITMEYTEASRALTLTDGVSKNVLMPMQVA